MIPKRHEGGCLCGAVRYAATGAPLRVSVCHCTYCQRRTGSAFAIVMAFPKDDVQVRGETVTHEHRSDVSGRWLRLHFCPRCGTTVTETTEKSPGTVIVQGGTLDDASWVRPQRQIWTRSRQAWLSLADIESHEEAYRP